MPINGNDPSAGINVEYEKDDKSGKPTENVLSKIINPDQQSYEINITDNAYKAKPIIKEVSKDVTSTLVLKLDKSFGLYDFSMRIKGFDNFEKRYAGRVETGKESFTDPYMGRSIGVV